MLCKALGVLWALCVIVRDLLFATERMQRKGGLYMTRFYLLGWPSRLLARTGWTPNLYLQHFHASDDPVPHNHPRVFVSLILSGGYLETVWRKGRGKALYVFEDKFVRLPGRWNVIPVTRYHYVELLDKARGCWTLCLVGPTWGRKWGFWHRGRHVPSDVYKRRLRAVQGQG